MKVQVEPSSWVRPTKPSMQSPPAGRNRLRTHKKSRGGCRNCKLRSIKCDESRPHCRKCVSYGVHCNFAHGVADMQLAAIGAIHIIEPKCHAFSIAQHNSAPCTEAALLVKFQSDVARTVSLGRRLALFQNEVLVLSNASPSLRHTMISLTLMHDRQNRMSSTLEEPCRRSMPTLSEQEIGHWYLASSCFNNDLKLALRNVPHEHLDIRQQAALCATSALLVALTFCYMEATTPEKAWPLAGGMCPSSPEELQWIQLSNGKLSAQALTQGLSTHPIFHPLVVVDEQDKSTFPSFNIDVPSINDECLLELEQSFPGPEMEAFTRIAKSSCFVTIVFSFWSFVGEMTADFQYGLRYKEPTALLTLLYWYAKLNPLPVWWLKARTSLEGRAICIYLSRYYGYDTKLMRLLQWPISILFDCRQGK